MLDYLGLILARERMQQQMGEEVVTPRLDEVLAGNSRPRRWRGLVASTLRATADRLDIDRAPRPLTSPDR